MSDNEMNNNNITVKETIKHDDFYQSLRKKIRDYFATEEGKTNKFAEYILMARTYFIFFANWP
jgi:hypothetical protein